MPQHPNEGPGDQLTMAGSFNAAYFAMYAHALAMLVFLRKDIGREGIGMAGLFTVLMMLFWGSYANCYPMFIYLLLWFAAVACQRINQYMNWRRGVVIHSRYSGYPFVSKRMFPRVSDLNARGVDAFLCFAIGGVLYQFNQPLGLFVMSGFVSILFVEHVTAQLTRRRMQAMKDQEIEMQYLADRYKSGRF